MTVKEAILTLNANVVVACERARFDSETVKVIEDAMDIIEDALQAQEPRVLTLEEATGEDECWFEFRPSNIGRYADCYLHDNPDRTRVYFTGKAVMSLFDNADYGKTWRCWTARPTDEQRKAAKWYEA